MTNAVAWLDWSQLISATVGAVVGAAAAAIPAYRLAVRTSREALERDKEARKELNRTAMHRALVKLVVIVNATAAIHRHIEHGVSSADASGHGANMRLWQKVMPVAGIAPNATRFDADDLAGFAAAGKFDFVTSLLEMAEGRIALEAGVREYNTMRKTLTDLLADLAPTMSGIMGSIVMTPQQAAKLEPRSVELDHLIGQLRARAAEQFSSAAALARRFGPVARGALNDPKFPILNVPDTPFPPAETQGEQQSVKPDTA